jgi:hypothetical protein
MRQYANARNIFLSLTPALTIAATASDWWKSIFTGTPQLGWEDTLAFLSLPLALFVSQSSTLLLIVLLQYSTYNYMYVSQYQ